LEIESRKDLKLVGRAIRERWNVDKEAIKLALMGCLSDPDLSIDAAKILVAADAIDCKREELEDKKEAKENEQRLRLLALAQSIPVAELTQLASENGIVSGSS
jgi:hypothetical protein